MSVLEAPEEIYAPRVGAPRTGVPRAGEAPRRTRVAPRRRSLRDFEEDFAEDFAEDGEGPARRRGAVKVRFRLGIPRTRLGWGLLAGTVLVVAGLGVAGCVAVRKMLLADERFVIPSSSAVEIQGNAHLTRAQLLSIFGGDVERNIFTVSLAERKAELERLPWVEHATVMRLLPDHLRVGIVERTPVAFVRQGGQIGLVDATGVLLDMMGEGEAKYSFPVVTGIVAADPLSTRTARMRIYRAFTTDLDSDGEKISAKLSEVDLSNPEDVKALIPEDGAEVLVHFGDTDFLARYKRFEALLPTWRAQYPKLAAVDMRYERQAVLEMQPGTAVPMAGAGQVETAGGADMKTAAGDSEAEAAPVAKGAPVPAGRAVKRAGPKPKVVAKRGPVVKKVVPAKKPKVAGAVGAGVGAKGKAAHLAELKAQAHAAMAKEKTPSGKPADATKVGAVGAGGAKYHPVQAVQ